MGTERVVGEYVERADERIIVFRHDGQTVELAVPRSGYGMLVVRTPEAGELERYYGLDMAVDHAAEVLGLGAPKLEIPEPAADMGI